MTTDVLYLQNELKKLEQTKTANQVAVDDAEALIRLRANPDFAKLMSAFIVDETARQVGMSISPRLSADRREYARIASTAGAVLEEYFSLIELRGDTAKQALEDARETEIHYNHSINELRQGAK